MFGLRIRELSRTRGAAARPRTHPAVAGPPELTGAGACDRNQRMNLKTFGQYLRGKSVNRLLHRARRKSTERILAHLESSRTLSSKRAQKRARGR